MNNIISLFIININMRKINHPSEFIDILNKEYKKIDNNNIIVMRWKNGIKLGEEYPTIINFNNTEDIITYYNENYNLPLVHNNIFKKYTKANSMLFFDDENLIIKLIYYKYDNRSYQYFDATTYLKVKNELISNSINKFTKGDFLFV